MKWEIVVKFETKTAHDADDEFVSCIVRAVEKTLTDYQIQIVGMSMTRGDE